MTGQAPRLGPAIGGLTGDSHRWGRFVFEKAVLIRIPVLDAGKFGLGH